MRSKERRKKKRFKVAVLVKCSIPKHSDEVFEIEMWAKDVNEGGMQLEWARGLTVNRLQKESASGGSSTVRFEDIDFSKGAHVQIQDLFYDDDGESPSIDGKILWVRQKPGSENWVVGVRFDDRAKQPGAMTGAFQDFISIVKNPTAAIAKATRKS